MKRNNLRIVTYLIGLFLLSTLLSGCSNRFEEPLRENHQVVSSNLNYLKEQLDSGQLANGLLINKYANALMQQKPDYADIASLLKQEESSQGKAYSALTKRLASVNLVPNNREAAVYGMQELQLINSAADLHEFNNALSDVVNTLASLSDGQLAVINVPASQRTSAQQTNALVGNPAYGNWRQNSSGTSFWAWYGMYSMFSNVVGMNRYSYGGWSSRPHYSYYGNHGRNSWGSSRDVNRNYDLSSRNPSRYNRPSAATKSRYATTKSSSRNSSYGSSSRRSSSSSSRSFRSGK